MVFSGIRAFTLLSQVWVLVAAHVHVHAQDVPQLDVPRTSSAPVVDGILDDRCWSDAPTIRNLGPARLVAGGGELPPTEVRIMWDPRALYVAFVCRDNGIHSMDAMGRDGDLYKADVCEVFIDGKGDQRQWIEIQVSPLNQVLDLVSTMTADPQYTAEMRLTQTMVERDFWSDRSWSAAGLVTASGRLFEGGKTVGWTVEMSIPAAAFLRRMGRDRIEPMQIRANFLRYDHPVVDAGRGFTQLNWAPVAVGCPHISPSAMGVLRLVDQADAAGGNHQPANGGTDASQRP